MKKSIILMLVLFLSTLIINSQDRYPKPFKFNYKVESNQRTNAVLDTNDLIQTKFHLGTQWYGHPRMLQALKMTVNHGTQEGNGIIANPNSDTFKMKFIWENKLADHSRAFQYEPTLYIPYSERGNFITKPNDKNRSIFGFSHILGTILPPSESENENYDRLILFKDSSYVNSVVLKDSWINNKYEFLGDPEKPYNSDPNIDGQKWILSINLRRLNINETYSDSTPLLTIKLPYKLLNDTNTYYIKFNKIAPTNINDSRLITYNTGTEIDTLGYYSNLRNNTENPYELNISDNLLPDSNFYNTNGRKDITLNAYFICDPITGENPFLRNGVIGIDTLNIEVKYHGNKDIAINYIRLMTTQAESYIAGNEIETLREIFQNVIDTSEAKGYEIYGINGRDEMSEAYFTFQRYLSYYFNFCTTTEGGGGNHFTHYFYHVQPHKVWRGALNFKNWVRAPYFYNHRDLSQNLEFRSYYRLFYPDVGYDDYGGVKKYNSEIETDIGYTRNTNTTNTNKTWWITLRYNNIDTIFYRDTIGEPKIYGMDMYKLFLLFSNTLGMYEIGNYNNFYAKDNYLYSERPWWGHNYVVGNWDLHPKQVIINGIPTTKYFAGLGNCRPQTGEEVRLIQWESLIYGAKGLTYDCWNDSLDYERRNKDRTLGFLNGWDKNKFDTAPFDEMLNGNDPMFGVDFIPETDTATMIHKYMDFDSTANHLGVPKDRIYYGRKSPKIEMFKTHSWIRANDNLLMDLRLVSAFSKGFRIWRSADTARYADTIMNSFVKLDNRMIIFDPNDSNKTLVSDLGIKTRPIDRIYNGEPYFEPYDSSFFDITLHRLQNDSTLTSNSIFIGLLNRRTDPLIYYDTTGMQPEDKYMRFLSTAEFQDSCTNNPTWWNQWWWRRLGTRELSVPLNLPNIAYGDGAYLQAKEIGLDKMDSLGVWFDEPYYHRIDTIIQNNGVLISKHLPGQGKIIELKKINLFDDTCNICDVVNDFELINFRVHKTSSEPLCCYEIILEKDTSCSFDSVPIKIITSGIESAEFDNAPMTDSSSGVKYSDMPISTGSNGYYTLGNLCVDPSESGTLEIVFGSNISELFYGCNRKFSFELDCARVTEFAENCCDNIDSLDEVHYRDSILQLCCTDVYLHPNDSIHCVYGIDFNISGSEQLNYVKKDTIPLQFGLSPELIFTYCGIFVNCIPPATESSFIQRKVKLRGKDDEIICEYTVDIMICCDIISDPGDPSDPPSGFGKSNSNSTIDKNAPHFKVIPNPTDGNLQLQINNFAKEIIDINIINQDSQVLKTFSNIQINNQTEELNLNINELPAGAYIVHIINSNINLSTKIIKLK